MPLDIKNTDVIVRDFLRALLVARWPAVTGHSSP
jgi:hypothetical protein